MADVAPSALAQGHPVVIPVVDRNAGVSAEDAFAASREGHAIRPSGTTVDSVALGTSEPATYSQDCFRRPDCVGSVDADWELYAAAVQSTAARRALLVSSHNSIDPSAVGIPGIGKEVETVVYHTLVPWRHAAGAYSN